MSLLPVWPLWLGLAVYAAAVGWLAWQIRR